MSNKRLWGVALLPLISNDLNYVLMIIEYKEGDILLLSKKFQ